MKRNIAVFAVIMVLALLAIYQNSATKNTETALPTDQAPRKDFLAPGLTLKGLDGQTYEVGGKRDKPLVLNFWASWCGPCEVEAPDLKKMYDKYKGELDIYGVNTTKNDFFPDVKGFVNQFDLKFPILLDEEGRATELYKLQIVPTSYLIDRNGVIVEVIHVLEPRDLERKLKSLIKS